MSPRSRRRRQPSELQRPLRRRLSRGGTVVVTKLRLLLQPSPLLNPRSQSSHAARVEESLPAGLNLLSEWQLRRGRRSALSVRLPKQRLLSLDDLALVAIVARPLLRRTCSRLVLILTRSFLLPLRRVAVPGAGVSPPLLSHCLCRRTDPGRLDVAEKIAKRGAPAL